MAMILKKEEIQGNNNNNDNNIVIHNLFTLTMLMLILMLIMFMIFRAERQILLTMIKIQIRKKNGQTLSENVQEFLEIPKTVVR